MFPFFPEGQGYDTHSSAVEGAEGPDGTRPCIEMVSSTVADAGGIDGTRPHWHCVFGLCTCRKMVSFLKLRFQVFKHRRRVNGLIKLKRNMWIADEADQLDAAFECGNMHDMYKHLGDITKYAKNKPSSQKICRVSNSDGLPTQSYAEEKFAFRSHFQSRCLQQLSLMVR